MTATQINLSEHILKQHESKVLCKLTITVYICVGRNLLVSELILIS